MSLSPSTHSSHVHNPFLAHLSKNAISWPCLQLLYMKSSMYHLFHIYHTGTQRERYIYNHDIIYPLEFHGDSPPVLQMGEAQEHPVFWSFCQAAAAAKPPPKPAKSWASEPILAASLTLAVTSTLIALRKSLWRTWCCWELYIYIYICIYIWYVYSYLS